MTIYNTYFNFIQYKVSFLKAKKLILHSKIVKKFINDKRQKYSKYVSYTLEQF